MAAKFDIGKDKVSKFRFHLKAANGQVIGAKAGAGNGIELVNTNAPGAAVVANTTI